MESLILLNNAIPENLDSDIKLAVTIAASSKPSNPFADPKRHNAKLNLVVNLTFQLVKFSARPDTTEKKVSFARPLPFQQVVASMVFALLSHDFTKRLFQKHVSAKKNLNK